MDLSEAAAGPPLDAAIIGGGINGAGIARAAAAAGLRVGLFERDDFGFGTTWRSTKLIHGGLRYLEHGDFLLVFESLRERKWLLETRPHLVHPQRLLFPMLPWTRRPAWQVRLGLFAYDAMAWGGGVPRHRWLKREAMERSAPFLAAEHDGGFSFYDARARAPERITIELACEAHDHGALVVNHAEVTGIGTSDGEVSSVEVRRDGETFEIPARSVINAAGPWADVVNRAAGIDAPELLGVTRGSHIVLDCDYPSRDAVFATARSDGRVFFAVPQEGLLLVGTTDERFDGDPGSVRPTRPEVDYLLEEARGLLPGLDIRAEHVRYAYAGLRPLPRTPEGPEAAITRRHDVIRHEEQGGPAGLYSVIGGKLSTFRPLAAEIVRLLDGCLPHDSGPVRPPSEWKRALHSSGLDQATQVRLRNYGPALEGILAKEPVLVSKSPPVLQRELEHVAHREFASTLDDVLLRRTGIGWGADRGLGCHREVAKALAGILGWSDQETEEQIAQYEKAVRFHLPTMEEIGDADA